MKHVTLTAALAATLCAASTAQQEEKPAPAPTKSRDFQREGNPQQREAKDKLEGKAPPELAVTRWMNIEGKSLSWSELKGKVILLKFWGVW